MNNFTKDQKTEVDLLKEALRDTVQAKQMLCNVIKKQNEILDEKVVRIKALEAKIQWYQMYLGN